MDRLVVMIAAGAGLKDTSWTGTVKRVIGFEICGENAHQLAFLHIPIPEYLDMYNDEKFYGEKEDIMGCPYVNTGFFDLVKEKGGI